eukprot:302910-Chlamydomonas_euryale.AAC.4
MATYSRGLPSARARAIALAIACVRACKLAGLPQRRPQHGASSGRLVASAFRASVRPQAGAF